MKKVIISMLLVIFTVLTACKNTNDKNPETTNNNSSDANYTQIPKTEAKTHNTSANLFDINSIPISTANINQIPFFNLPERITYLNKPLIREYDEIYFPLDTSDHMEKIGGKSFKAFMTESDNSQWSQPYFTKSYEEALKSVGGVLVFDGKINKEQLKYYKDNATYKGEEGTIGYSSEPVKVYVIRRPNGDDIYFQFYSYSAGGSIQIVQKEVFKQTITILKSDQIQKELTENGKVVLHINFDTDKATLKTDGKDAVAEISKALQSDSNLKISINGYTDNTGKDLHNLQLSKDRAETVKKAIIESGIDDNRLASDGFGSKSPIADNSTEEGKAQNRRVELIKQ